MSSIVYATDWLDSKQDCPTVYVLFHEKTKKFYYESNPAVNLFAFKAKDRDEAYAIEQLVLTINVNSGLLLNRAMDALSNTGVEFTSDVRAKMQLKRLTSGGGKPPKTLSVDGVKFDSISVAANTLGLGRKAVRFRAKSDTYPNYVLL